MGAVESAIRRHELFLCLENEGDRPLFRSLEIGRVATRVRLVNDQIVPMGSRLTGIEPADPVYVRRVEAARNAILEAIGRSA